MKSLGIKLVRRFTLKYKGEDGPPGSQYSLWKSEIKTPVFFEQINGINDPPQHGYKKIPFLLPSCVTTMCTATGEKKRTDQLETQRERGKQICQLPRMVLRRAIQDLLLGEWEGKTNRFHLIHTHVRASQQRGVSYLCPWMPKSGLHSN